MKPRTVPRGVRGASFSPCVRGVDGDGATLAPPAPSSPLPPPRAITRPPCRAIKPAPPPPAGGDDGSELLTAEAEASAGRPLGASAGSVGDASCGELGTG